MVSLDDLIMSGPLHKGDITYSLIQGKADLEKMEAGFAINEWVEKAAAHDVWTESKVTFKIRIHNLENLAT